MEEVLFEVMTPLGFSVRTTRSYWQTITSIKHPAMLGHEIEVKNTLQYPEEIRQSKQDSSVYLFYKTWRANRWVCAVSKKVNGNGFLITAYPTDTIKTGEKIWPK
ncbi:MAG: DUF4258 domain-containing protein [Candidatus Omnitrophica bacterium]|nr:DUF4258 domain-containing protein [Candidatus Omnitrophota bacterium]